MRTDLWELDADAPEWLPTIIYRLLEVGVPPTSCAKAFDVDVQVIKDMQTETRVEKFGTAELSEAMFYMIWKAYEQMLELMETAPLDKRLRILTNLMTRASSMAEGQAPDSMKKMQDEFASLAADLSTAESPGAESSIYELIPTDNVGE